MDISDIVTKFVSHGCWCLGVFPTGAWHIDHLRIWGLEPKLNEYGKLDLGNWDNIGSEQQEAIEKWLMHEYIPNRPIWKIVIEELRKERKEGLKRYSNERNALP